MKTIKNRNVNGRPKKSATEKKSYKVTVKLATAEYYSLKSKAKEASDTISNFIRNAILRSKTAIRRYPFKAYFTAYRYGKQSESDCKKGKFSRLYESKNGVGNTCRIY